MAHVFVVYVCVADAAHPLELTLLSVMVTFVVGSNGIAALGTAPP
jgi:hypothetical protein